MIAYDGLKTDFLCSCENDSIAIKIEENILSKLGRHTPKAEFRSWENSLNYMYKVLNDDEIPSDAGVAIEFNIPQTSKRVDFIISGYGADSDPEVVIIELNKGEAIWDIAILVKKKVITIDDLEGFSEELIEAVKLILSR